MVTGTMDSKRGTVCGRLPVEIMERVLSFLPVPVLCRMRSVCKTWRELISRPSFHDLCDLNGPNNVYLFMWKVCWDGMRGAIEPSFTRTFSFLDLEARRWYSIQASELPRVCACGNEIETRMMAMDDGLVCELTSSRGTENNFALILSDPVAKTRRMLPTPPVFYGGPRVHIVTVVDDSAGSYKVFLLNNLGLPNFEWESLPRVYEHESSTNEWRGQRNLPNGVEGLWAVSAVALHQTVFVSRRTIHPGLGFDKVRLLSYKPQGDIWAEVWRMSFYRTIRDEKLVVSEDRLFLILWTEGRPENPLPPIRCCPNSQLLFQTNQDYPKTLLEVYEVLIAENSIRPVVQLTDAQLQQIFGSDDPSCDVACGFPCFNSNGMCNSIVLVSNSTGQIRRYYLATESVDVLPPHPLVQTSEELAPANVYDLDPSDYDAKTTKLSLRNLLAQPRKTGTSTGWRLLQ